MSYDREMTPMNGAYTAGLLFGWASRLENIPFTTKEVVNEMKDFAELLAKRSGVTLFDKKVEN